MARIEGVGTLSSAQVDPVRDSAMGSWLNWEPLGEMYEPTAVQSVAEVQDTEARAVAREPSGAGALCGVQLEPFQTSTSGSCSPVWFANSKPTAVHDCAVAHDTLFRTP